jgi:hypothetical protein
MHCRAGILAAETKGEFCVRRYDTGPRSSLRWLPRTAPAKPFDQANDHHRVASDIASTDEQDASCLQARCGCPKCLRSFTISRHQNLKLSCGAAPWLEPLPVGSFSWQTRAAPAGLAAAIANQVSSPTHWACLEADRATHSAGLPLMALRHAQVIEFAGFWPLEGDFLELVLVD